MLSLSDQSFSATAKTDLGEEFASHCIKSTPTPEFLLKLTQFDMSLLSFRARHPDSRIPEFLVWFYQKVSWTQS